MNKIINKKSLVLFVLITYFFITTGCSTFIDIPSKKETASTLTEKNEDTENAGDRFYRRNTEMIHAVETHNISKEIKVTRETLKKGHDFRLFWFIPVNVSTSGLTYSKKFLEKENGSVEIVVDEKGKGNLTLSVLF